MIYYVHTSFRRDYIFDHTIEGRIFHIEESDLYNITIEWYLSYYYYQKKDLENEHIYIKT